MTAHQDNAANTANTNAARRKHRPVRGALSGLVLGLGLVILLIVYSAVPFSSILPAILIVVACMLLGAAIGVFGPAHTTDSSRQVQDSGR